ncbi:TPA: cupin domain-containing protein, partial [Escherichia coli]|nr:cupin domain-containing protein [Escherichia coli]
NLIIVNTKDALLIADRADAQNIKDIIKKLKTVERRELDYFTNEFRSWGMIEKIDYSTNHVANRITINPGKKISQQIHYHRNEHWIVVSGTALINIDGEDFLLSENESTFIKIGQEHSIMNPGIVPLIIIEIQTGKFISEKDVIRVRNN